MWQKIKCLLGKHNLKIIRNLGPSSILIGCNKCGGYWGMNYDVRTILPFTDEMYEMYRTMGKRGIKKYISYKPFWIFPLI